MFSDNKQRLVFTRPPCNLRDMKKIAREVTDQYNGKKSDLAKKGEPLQCIQRGRITSMSRSGGVDNPSQDVRPDQGWF